MKYIVVKEKHNLKEPGFVQKVCNGATPQAIYKVTAAPGLIPVTESEFKTGTTYIIRLCRGYIVLLPENTQNAHIPALVKELEKLA
ncbi:hypothetical protein AM493_11825 [Flavobacterium akiainvivens]|uniref:Uncharacterized protein n=1 Tax=Flavobacterium akiainvivens TaxID=1202724 RepID=A0A0M8MDM4_9FLAO|nr:hypothetical protein [Flavobacterium akiainvivens]KOS06644.1 hypothetical protein AM493_11825 [Flavobacterium akiainvivens]SFQ70331.1 hypothetical protein SAMN05444144_1164 [Flavobacterium akiainvivens]